MARQCRGHSARCLPDRRPGWHSLSLRHAPGSPQKQEERLVLKLEFFLKYNLESSIFLSPFICFVFPLSCLKNAPEGPCQPVSSQAAKTDAKPKDTRSPSSLAVGQEMADVPGRTSGTQRPGDRGKAPFGWREDLGSSRKALVYISCFANFPQQAFVINRSGKTLLV